jgi:hypothetical protein
MRLIHNCFIHLLDMMVHEISVLWAPRHAPSLNFCSSSSKAKPKAMQEIWDNTSVDPYLDLPNGLMRPYLAVPTHLMELFVKIFTISWAVERWNISSVSFLLSLFFNINRREYDTMVHQHLALRHSFCMCFLTSAQQMLLLILSSKSWICGAHG